VCAVPAAGWCCESCWPAEAWGAHSDRQACSGRSSIRLTMAGLVGAHSPGCRRLSCDQFPLPLPLSHETSSPEWRVGERRAKCLQHRAPVNPTLLSTSTPSPRFHAPSRPESALHACDYPLNRLLNRLLPESLPWLVPALFSEYIPITDSASSRSSPFPNFPTVFTTTLAPMLCYPSLHASSLGFPKDEWLCVSTVPSWSEQSTSDSPAAHDRTTTPVCNRTVKVL
jgi:hypothetical protein